MVTFWGGSLQEPPPPFNTPRGPTSPSLRYPFSATPNLPEVLALALAGTGSAKDHLYLVYPD